MLVTCGHTNEPPSHGGLASPFGRTQAFGSSPGGGSLTGICGWCGRIRGLRAARTEIAIYGYLLGPVWTLAFSLECRDMLMRPWCIWSEESDVSRGGRLGGAARSAEIVLESGSWEARLVWHSTCSVGAEVAKAR